jgi:hypothetical protein
MFWVLAEHAEFMVAVVVSAVGLFFLTEGHQPVSPAVPPLPAIVANELCT